MGRFLMLAVGLLLLAGCEDEADKRAALEREALAARVDVLHLERTIADIESGVVFPDRIVDINAVRDSLRIARQERDRTESELQEFLNP